MHTMVGGPYGFVTGPDSNNWFTESLGKIAKIPPSRAGSARQRDAAGFTSRP